MSYPSGSGQSSGGAGSTGGSQTSGGGGHEEMKKALEQIKAAAQRPPARTDIVELVDKCLEQHEKASGGHSGSQQHSGSESSGKR